ncbi:MAG TPA: 50S ribosomal protein L28, partial [Candidatus Paceibacterota bacterium]|nr:50S ribosomal protein L28 [Candidatus Paceibacterota bacterium]
TDGRIKYMARSCDITGKTSQVGGGYSNRTRATKFNPTGSRRRQVNMQKKTIFLPELGRKITVNVSAKGLKTMKKRGAYATLKKAGLV